MSRSEQRQSPDLWQHYNIGARRNNFLRQGGKTFEISFCFARDEHEILIFHISQCTHFPFERLKIGQ
jgi:hypothetical protein